VFATYSNENIEVEVHDFFVHPYPTKEYELCMEFKAYFWESGRNYFCAYTLRLPVRGEEGRKLPDSDIVAVPDANNDLKMSDGYVDFLDSSSSLLPQEDLPK
jgi:hypothetical protein